MIARLKELLRDLFQYLDVERTSLKQRRTISPITTAAAYCGSPRSVVIEIADEITLISIIMPPYNYVNLFYVLINYKIKLLFNIKNFCKIWIFSIYC